MIGTSPDGRWELRFTNTFEVNDAGHGNGSWRYDLIDRAIGTVVRSWHGHATRSPWDESSRGTRSVAWDGDLLIVVDEDGTEQRVAPGQ